MDGGDGAELTVAHGRQRHQRVALVELERVAGLWPDVHAHHVESGPVVTHRRAARPAEQVQQPGTAQALTTQSNVTDPTVATLSVAVAVTVNVPEAVIVPEITPDALMASPGGWPVTDHELIG